MQPEQARDRPWTGGFVGREHELGELEASLHEALGGRARLVLLVGEPGIGKTSTAEEFGAKARSQGAEVLWGSCYEGEGAPAYWPWVQLIRGVLELLDDDTLRAELMGAAPDLLQLAPEVKDRIPELPGAHAMQPDQARFRLYDSVAALLRSASVSRPLVAVLDDVHWADEPSLLLLEFVARELKDARVLVLATYRQEEIGRPLAQVLGRLTVAGRVPLRGLAEREVAEVIARSTGGVPGPPWPRRCTP